MPPVELVWLIFNNANKFSIQTISNRNQIIPILDLLQVVSISFFLTSSFHRALSRGNVLFQVWSTIHKAQMNHKHNSSTFHSTSHEALYQRNISHIDALSVDSLYKQPCLSQR